MGGEQSHPYADVEGFQITYVHPGSPAHDAGLVPFFDYIVHMDNLSLRGESTKFFVEYMTRNLEQPVKLQVLNVKVRQVRDVVVTPKAGWGGEGIVGCSICWTNVGNAAKCVWHVTGVHPGSPGHTAGFKPLRDYIVGMEGLPGNDGIPVPRIVMFPDTNALKLRIEDKLYRQQLRRSGRRDSLALFLVWDSQENVVREVLLDLAGQDSLGIDVANGYIHGVPYTAGDAAVPVLGGSCDVDAAAGLAKRVVEAAEAALPEGWLEVQDPGTGRTYYAHPASQRSSWERPVAADGLPPQQQVE
eukprot:TRINITY_DN41024_c0_g1_i1.p1 TRINITY_DN41024_c0_g1~~TRINITY_DN41024_c0_g1_i1.p1  ORF type:complete len:301 (+),score=79.36 TRINITY_DN41024_c0_g1_i1:69-971(+)